MKTFITVLLDHSTQNLFEQLEQALEPHRLDEDSPDAFDSYYWDYWTLSDGLDDQELKKNYPNESAELLDSASYVRNLPEDYYTSGLICDGSWADLRDFGYCLVHEPCPANDEAEIKWLIKLGQLLANNSDKIAICVMIHC